MNYTMSSDKIISKRMDDELIIINLENGVYYGIEGVAMPIWEALTAHAAPSDIVALLSTSYPDEAHTTAAYTGFVEELLSAGLIKEHDAPDASMPELVWPKTWEPPFFEAYEDVSALVALDPPLPELD